MATALTIVDAFTSEPFRGNPAAVCLLDGPADETWMRDVAREMNLSETAFCHPDGTADHPDALRLRWLTPTIEVDLCGHATLATAHVLATERAATGPIRFVTRSGMLTASVTDGGIELDFPADPTAKIAAPDGLLAALGLDHATVHLGTGFHLVEVADADTVRALDPDIGALAKLESRGMIVTAPGDGDLDVVSRVFAPWSGIDEDPVTGSAHCMIGPHWASRLGATLHCHQASARGGDVTTVLDGDRVRLTGQAVTVAHTTLHF